MARKRNADGQWVGKEDFAPELALERFWNEKNVEIAIDQTNSASAEMTSFKTGMSVEETGDADESMELGRKWVLRGVLWEPANTQHLLGSDTWGTAGGIAISLQYPGHTVKLSAGQRGCIAHSRITVCQAGAAANIGPLIVYPIPFNMVIHKAVFAEDLEFWVRTEADSADFRGALINAKLIYGWAPATNRDLIIARQQSG